jgi:hypothetical protein
MIRLRAMIWPTCGATLAAAFSSIVWIIVDCVARGLPVRQMVFDTGVLPYFLKWSVIAGLFAALCSLILVRSLNRWWTFAIAGITPLMVAAIATWPPPHLTHICADALGGCGSQDDHFEMLWGQQREAWQPYLVPLIKYAATMLPACIAYFLIGRNVQLSNNRLERQRHE